MVWTETPDRVARRRADQFRNALAALQARLSIADPFTLRRRRGCAEDDVFRGLA